MTKGSSGPGNSLGAAVGPRAMKSAPSIVRIFGTAAATPQQGHVKD